MKQVPYFNVKGEKKNWYTSFIQIKRVCFGQSLFLLEINKKDNEMFFFSQLNDLTFKNIILKNSMI